MVNKIKKFFKSIGKSSSSASSTGSASMSSANGVYPLLATVDNQFCHQYQHQHQQQQESHHSRSNNVSLSSNPSLGLGKDSIMAMSVTEGSVSSSDSMNASPHRNQNAIRWGLLLPKIPRLVAEATAASSSANNSSSNNNNTGSPHSSQSPSSSLSQGDDNVEMNALLEMLTQMAPKELQTQIAQYYSGDTSAGNSLINSNTPTVMISNWEQRKVFRQCRRSLLLCWKFIIAQLNDETARVTSELKETYFQLIGLIAERVEFNLSGDTSASSSSSSVTSSAPRSAARRENNSGHMMGWTVNSPTATSNASSINSIDIDSGNASDNNNSSLNGDEGVDGERDLYLYRCLLVATFKYVVENIEGAKLNRRSWITLTELQFFAKVIAICFFRIPVIQRMVIDQIYFTYRQKKWTNTATSSSSSSEGSQSASSSSSSHGGGRPTTPETPSRSSRRRSSSRLGSGVTFAGSLSRWSEFEGHVLSESTNDESEDSNNKEDAATESNQSSHHQQHQASNASLPTRAAMDKFKRTNPTLYRWSRYVPYLAPYADSDVFRMNDSMKMSWLEKLSHDGEFFAVFMAHYAQHAETCAVGEIVWSSLPGYQLLIRVSLLLLKETSWNKWLYMRDNTSGSFAPSSLTMNGLKSPSSSQQDERDPFELKSIRSIGTVLESAVHWLRNKELLESCTLAVYECTNVLNARSVSFCLTRFEEWFSATAALVPGEVEKLVYKLPASFTGQTFAIGIRLMLSSESFEILNRVLTFLYNRMEYFDGDLRQNILKVLVQRHMFLFLHWNVDVRSNYHHLLVYKLIRVNRYFLDSPIDQLLIGRHAVSQIENSISVTNGFDEFDDHLGGVVTPYASQYHNGSNSVGNGTSNNYSSNRQYQISASEFSALRTEQALWRAFDACIGAICVQERRNAKEGNRKYQYEIQCARSRAVAFQKLNRNMADELNPSSSVNEGLPGGKPWLELDLLDDELHREPPYYLRYLPAEEVSSIDELRRLASTLRYPPELQVYAAASLRHYSDLLKKYYQDLSQNNSPRERKRESKKGKQVRMQRPQSEGRVSSPPRRQRHPNRHRKTSVLSKSCVLFSESSSPSGGGDGHQADNHHNPSLGGEPRIKDGNYDRPPRRPKTTPKPRIERLLIGPGKAHIQEAHSSSGATTSSAAASGSTLFFMTHLPDSPPRPNRSFTTQIASTSLSDGEDDNESDGNDRDKGKQDMKRLCQLSRTKKDVDAQPPAVAASLVPTDKDEEQGDDELEHPQLLVSGDLVPGQTVTSRLTASLESSDSHEEQEEEIQYDDRGAPHSDNSEPENYKADAVEPSIADGPLQIDILMSSSSVGTATSSPTYPQLNTSDEEGEDDEDIVDTKVSASGSEPLTWSSDPVSSSDTIAIASISDGVLEGDDEYSRSLATRRRMAQEEQHREQLRGELESYMTLLTTRKGEDGAQLVEFPRNYRQVLSLMSERDVRDEDTANSANANGNSNGGQRSWSHVLIQAGLSEQQAFGALNDEDEANGGEGSMAAKIALKMARVRQLDAVLEEKLGKNLYAASTVTDNSSSSKGLVKKTKPGATDPGGNSKPAKEVAPNSNNNQQSASTGDDSLAPLSITASGGVGTNSKGGSNFIERNRKVIAHGMKAVLSKDEESRLNRLLRDLSDDTLSEAPGSAMTPNAGGEQAAPAPSVISTEPLGRNEFEMDATDKKQIEELLTAKCGVYQTSLLPPEESIDLGNDDEVDLRDGNELVPSSTSSSSTARKSKSAFNIIQATKKERLRKQRLERIEQEIQFLKANECMSIVADDEDDSDAGSMFNDDTFSDVTSTVGDDGRVTTAATSERSFRTTTSSVANSICSTRSGVISRRQFNQFLAFEKQEFKPETKASADEIRRLVASLSHLRTTTPTTSGPVA